MIKKNALTSVPINPLIAARWSGRAFNPDRPVEPEKIQALIEAARWAPSCFGDEPWRYVICNRYSNHDAWERALSCLSEGNRDWAVNAPLLLLVCANTVFRKNGKPNRWAQYDTGAASMSLCIQATDLGLMVHQMGGYDTKQAAKLFNVPDTFTSMAMMAVGYQFSREELGDDLSDRELSERQRSDLNELFFDGTWDAPLGLTSGK